MTREEALKEVKTWVLCSRWKETLRTLIPELAESEDERIRKELIEQVGYLIPDKEEYDDEGRVLPTYHKRIGRYRAWLEKQKEPENVSASSMAPSCWQKDEYIDKELVEKLSKVCAEIITSEIKKAIENQKEEDKI